MHIFDLMFIRPHAVIQILRKDPTAVVFLLHNTKQPLMQVNSRPLCRCLSLMIIILTLAVVGVGGVQKALEKENC